jgi:hypothetical protein
MYFYPLHSIIIFMSTKKSLNSPHRSRIRKIRMSSTAQGLTSQAGLIPLVKYLERIGFEKIVARNMAHSRGDNAVYQLSDVVLLTLIGMTGGATSMVKIAAVWADSVLRTVAG